MAKGWRTSYITLDLGAITEASFIVAAPTNESGLNSLMSVEIDYTGLDVATATIDIGASNFDKVGVNATFNSLLASPITMDNGTPDDVDIWSYNNKAYPAVEDYKWDGTLDQQVADNSKATTLQDLGTFPYRFLLFKIGGADGVSTGDLKIAIAQFEE